MLPANLKSAYFIGIGGIGMSALAWMLHAAGIRVSGSDRAKTDITEKLTRAGMDISYGTDANRVADTVDLVVYSKAVPNDHPELVEARTKNIPTLSYPELLGTVSAEKKTIAVSGTHGKTTTTAMLAKVLIDGGVDPTVVVGSTLLEQGSNFVGGSGEYFLTEACEYKRSFLELSPHILVITNIDLDHLDYYRNLQDIQEAFGDLAMKVPKDGFIICRPESVSVSPVIADVEATVIDYSPYIHAPFTLPVPGEYNRENAAAAIAAAQALGLPEEQVYEALADFAGTWRRFEYRGRTPEGAHLYDDYAHHPHEVTALLQGVRERYVDEEIIAVFQPHLHQRTADFLDEFATSLARADTVVVLPVYEARAEEDQSVTHRDLIAALQEREATVYGVDDMNDAVNRIRSISGPGSVIITIGAGDVYQVADGLIQG